MIGIIEKIMWGLTGLAILCFAVVWLVLGPPTTTPQIAGSGKKIASEEEFKARIRSAEALEAYDAQAAQAAPVVEPEPEPDAENPDGRKRVTRKRTVQPPIDFRVVNHAVYDRLSNKSSAIQELQGAKSTVVENRDGTKGLKVFGFDKMGTFGKLGLEENDVVKLVDGVTIDPTDRAACVDLYEAMREKLERGEAIFVDIERHGSPVQLRFFVGDE